MNFRKKAFTGLGLVAGAFISGLVLPFPYPLGLFIPGVILIIQANRQRKKENQKKIKYPGADYTLENP